MALAISGLRAEVTVEATINPIGIVIGEQAGVTVKVSAPESAVVVFPQYKPQQELTPGVEVAEASEETTEKIDGGLVVRQRTYLITSFDGKLYYLPPFKVKVDGKEYASKSLALKVVEVEVDTTKLDEYRPLKGVQDNPFLWSEWATPFWLSVLMVLILALDGYLYVCLRRGKPVATPKLRHIKRLLPHQKAMKKIEEIKADRMTGSEDQKEYYTRLTDTLRNYIRERYGFNAMEMTSTEIIARLMQESDAKSIDELTTLFHTADLVKFAKYSTLINENDMNLVSAIDFINSTKQENMPTEQVVRPQVSEEDKRRKEQRTALKISVAAATVLAAALLVAITWMVYQLMV